jgi:hypothetical protein
MSTQGLSTRSSTGLNHLENALQASVGFHDDPFTINSFALDAGGADSAGFSGRAGCANEMAAAAGSAADDSFFCEIPETRENLMRAVQMQLF